MAEDNSNKQSQQQPQEKEEKVVSFLNEKEEKRMREGKFYTDRARAKKRERKERYKARKAEEKQEQITPEEATTQMLRELGAEHGGGAIDSIVGNTYLSNAIPEEFRGEFDAIVDAYGPETDVPDIDGGSKRRSRSAQAKENAKNEIGRASCRERV